MSKRSRQKRSASARLLWLLSLVMVGSMVISLIIVGFPGPAEPAPTLPPTPRPALPSPTHSPGAAATPQPTDLPASTVAVPATASPLPIRTPEATEPAVGPVLPTATPVITPTGPAVGPLLPSATPEVTPTLTPAAAGSSLVFAVCGDSRGNPLVFGEVLIWVTSDGSQFLIHTGDLVNSGTDVEWQQFARDLQGYPLPFYPVPGNHDGLDGKLDGFLAYSGAPDRHYSFDRGPAHFTLADSHNGGIGAAELAWLRQDLTAAQKPLKFVVLHHPPFDPDGTDHVMAYGNESFMALMEEMSVDYVVAGHIHAYARSQRNGVEYLYTGGAGAPLYTEGHPYAFHHYLRFTVEGERVAVEVVRL